jgi:hypothetical protein
MRLTLEHPGDLEKAATLASWLGRPTVDEVLVRLPWLNADEREKSASAVRRLFNDCGCAAAAATFALATSALLTYWLVVAGWSWPHAGMTVLIGVAAGLGGKLLALAWSRHRLRALLLWLGPDTARSPDRGERR